MGTNVLISPDAVDGADPCLSDDGTRNAFTSFHNGNGA